MNREGRGRGRARPIVAQPQNQDQRIVGRTLPRNGSVPAQTQPNNASAWPPVSESMPRRIPPGFESQIQRQNVHPTTSAAPNDASRATEKPQGLVQQPSTSGLSLTRPKIVGRSAAKAYVTKPTTTQSKRGVSGQIVNLSANYFRLIKKPTFDLVRIL